MTQEVEVDLKAVSMGELGIDQQEVLEPGLN